MRRVWDTGRHAALAAIAQRELDGKQQRFEANRKRRVARDGADRRCAGMAFGCHTPSWDLSERVVSYIMGNVRSPITTYLMLAAGIPAVDLQHMWPSHMKPSHLRRWDPWEPNRSVCVEFS